MPSLSYVLTMIRIPPYFKNLVMESTVHFITPEEKNERRAKVMAFIFALFLIFLMLYPFWSYTFPPPGQEGVLITFGQLEAGSNDIANDVQGEQLVEEPNIEEHKETSAEEKLRTAPPVEKLRSETVNVKSKTPTQEKSDVVVQEKAIQSEKSAIKPNKPSAEELASQKAAEDAKKQEEYEKAKKKFGSLIGKGTDSDTNSGNPGDPSGDPTADALSGISKGTGNIGGGLAKRGRTFEPEIEENSQKAGLVVVRVCVNDQGKVVEAKYTLKGSTTTDTDLVQVAIAGAKRYRFSKSPIERQCGTITIEFKLK